MVFTKFLNDVWGLQPSKFLALEASPRSVSVARGAEDGDPGVGSVAQPGRRRAIDRIAGKRAQIRCARKPGGVDRAFFG